MSADNLELSVDRTAIRPRLAVRGDLHLRTRDALIRAVIEALDGADALDLDLAGVGFCDSMGVSALIAARNLAAMDDKRLTIVAMSPAVGSILRVTGLLEALGPTPDTRPDAPSAG